ncbi:TonB family protein [Lysobacter sp. A289]
MEALLILLLSAAAADGPASERPVVAAPVTLPPHTPAHARSVSLKVSFVVLPSGATSDVRLEGSSGQRPCDRALLEAVKRWKYAPRSEPLHVTETVETCSY